MPVLLEHLADALAQLHDVGVELPPLQAPRVSVRRLDLRLLVLYDVSQGPEIKSIQRSFSDVFNREVCGLSDSGYK